MLCAAGTVIANAAVAGGAFGGDDGDGDGVDVATDSHAVRNTVPAVQALNKPLSHNTNRASLPCAAGTVTANAATTSGAAGGNGGDSDGDVGGGGGDGDDSNGGSGVDGVDADVAANCRTARNTVPAAHALNEHLLKIEMPPSLSATDTVIAATVDGTVDGDDVTVAVLTVATSPPTVVLSVAPCQRLRLWANPFLK